MRDLTRRQFVTVCAVGCGAALVTGCVAMVTHPLPLVGGQLRVSLAQFPELLRPGGAIKVQPAGVGHEPILVLATGDNFSAVSPICTHRGCTVDVSGERLVCPCHGSTYDRDGRVLKGPAQEPLTRYVVRRAGDELVVELAS